MPMGIVSDKDFDKERDNLSPVPSLPISTSPSAEIVDVNKGRPSGSVEVPDSLRRVIGDTSVTDGRQEALALGNAFGISPSSVSAYSNGATSTASYNDTPNKPVVDAAKLRVQKKARQKLMLAINGLTPEKMETAKARDLAGIAKDMAAVIRTMEPETNKPGDNVNNGPTFIFYSPQQRKEEVYDVVFAKD